MDIQKDTGTVVKGMVLGTNEAVDKTSGEIKYKVTLFIPANNGNEKMNITLLGKPDPKRFPSSEIVQLKIMIGKFNDPKTGNSIIYFKEVE